MFCSEAEAETAGTLKGVWSLVLGQQVPIE
jgi:hypothetical protein